MLLCFFVTCFSSIIFSKSLLQKPLPPWATEMRLLSFWFWKQLFHLSFFGSTIFKVKMASATCSNANLPERGRSNDANTESSASVSCMSILDLPELALECILEKLPPEALCNMAGVCNALRERCISNHLWENHMKRKWGGVIGPAAYREWQWQLASRKDVFGYCKQARQKGLVKRLLSMFWSSRSRIKLSSMEDGRQIRNPLLVDSAMSWYLALETGRFWFPAQIYNRENGHVGFMLSCYDAELSYDSRTDTFQARYPPHGRRAIAIENNVSWERLRAPPVDASPHDLYISDCLDNLCPNDHFEIQWRRNKEFPYGWWYGVVGHLESCDGNEYYCLCRNSDTIVLEFHQYTPGSRWRHTIINRKNHREEGNEADGFYGGIRKLNSTEEISRWKQLWPTRVLE